MGISRFKRKKKMGSELPDPKEKIAKAIEEAADLSADASRQRDTDKAVTTGTSAAKGSTPSKSASTKTKRSPQRENASAKASTTKTRKATTERKTTKKRTTRSQATKAKRASKAVSGDNQPKASTTRTTTKKKAAAKPPAAKRKTNEKTQSTTKQDPKPVIAVSATFTAEPIEAGLRFWSNTLDQPFDIAFAPYNQVFQELLNPGSLLSTNTRGMNLLLVRFEDWLRNFETDGHPDLSKKLADPTKAQRAYMQATLQELIDALEAYGSRTPCATYFLLAPPSKPYGESKGWQALFAELDNKLFAALANLNSVDAARVQDFHDRYAVANFHDAIRDEMGHIPYVDAYFHVLATLAVRRFYATLIKPYKVIVLDCDNTLWGGVCGEVGAEGVALDAPFHDWHHFLIRQTEQGMVLCLASKNVEEDVWQVFDNRSDMVLKREHVVDGRINWQPKSQNIRDLAATLNLGSDSFIFVDDNPVECAEVRANCPEVTTLQWPADAAAATALYEHAWIFDHFSVTEEDKKRSKMYQANVERERVRSSSNDFNSFLDSLQLDIDVAPVNAETMPRTSQLTNRTNQFNFTTIRRTQSEVQQIVDSGSHQVWTCNVSDRFGTYGLVGVMMLTEDGEDLLIDSFMLSCRVLGRGVEHRMMNHIGKMAADKGLKKVKLRFLNTAKNEPAEKFVDSIRGKYRKRKIEGGFEILFDPEYLQKVAYQPASLADAVAPTSKVKLDDVGDRALREREHLFMEMGQRYGTMAALQAAVAGEPAPKKSAVPPAPSVHESAATRTAASINQTAIRGGLVTRLRQIFARVLGIDAAVCKPDADMETYVDDSFKNVEITVGLKEDFPELPTTVLFEHRTIDSIADALLASSDDLATRFPEWVTSSEKQPTDTPHQASAYKSTTPTVTQASEASPSAVDSNRPIAIVGMNGIFPGAANLDVFWQNLRAGQSHIGEVPGDRWNVNAYFDGDGRKADKTYSKWGGFLDAVDHFDARFFSITGKEAELMDPQQRLFLQCVWGLLENAGYTRQTIARETGVFVGVIAADYGTLTAEASLQGMSAYRGSDYYQIPNRVSYFFDFQGPSIALDTACSASGTSLHLACESLRKGECKTAVAGGVNLFLHPSRYVQYSQLQFMSPDGVIRPFGDQAQGTVFGEGIGALLLKPLEEAVADGDMIHGVILGSSVNSGGKTNGFTVPNPTAQASLVARAVQTAQIDPRSISYVEAHGTGTPLGDPIEVRGLTMAFQRHSDYEEDRQFCALGSVKSNIGHLESAAAISGIIKTLLQMKHGELAPSLHAETLNPQIPFKDTPFFVNQTLQPWKRPTLPGQKEPLPRRAGVSSFGAGGSNAHVILEEYPDRRPTSADIDGPLLFVLSAREEDRLLASADQLAKFLEQGNDSLNLVDVAYTLQIGREAMPIRAAILAETRKALITKLHSLASGTMQHKDEGIFLDNARSSELGSSMILDDEEGETFLRLVIKNRRLPKLARLWVGGIDIDWNLLYGQVRPRRIALPTYPFKGERYWFNDNQQKGNWLTRCELRGGESVRQSLHPLIDCNDSTLEQQAYRKVLKADEFVLKDHVLEDELILPAVAYLEMARAAGNLAYRRSRVRKLQNIVWARRIDYKHENQEVIITLVPNGNFVDYEVSSIDDEGSRLVNAQGKILYEDRADYTVGEESLDLHAIHERCWDPISRERCYELYRHLGFNYGPGFMAVQELHHNETEALSLIELPKEVRYGFGNWLLHPSLMDGALQSVIALTGDSVVNSDTPFLPFGMGEVEIIHPLAEKCFVYVKLASQTRTGSSQVRKFNIRITDEKGTVLVRMRDYSLRAVPREGRSKDGSKLAIDKAPMYFHTIWDKAPMLNTPATFPPGENVLILDNRTNLRDGMRSRLASSDFDTSRILLALPGKQFRDEGDGTFQLNPKRAADFRSLLAALREQDRFPTKIICFWGQEPFSPIKKLLSEQLTVGVYTLFHLSQTLLENKLSGKVLVQCIFPSRKGDIQPQYAALGACARTIRKENPKLLVKAVELRGNSDGQSTTNLDQVMDIIVTEGMPETESDVEILYEKGQRWLRTQKEFDLSGGDHVEKPESRFRDKGVYVLTGGAGGLGLLFADYLARTYRARLVLTGRSAINQTKKDSIAKLESHGAEVIYLQSDVSIRRDVKALVRETKNRFGEINGIIHAAGLIKDNFLIKKSADEIEAVLAPKIYGTVYLDEETANEPLDLFVMFSSLTSVIGNIAQYDYAFANGFMDHYANMRHAETINGHRSGCTLTINWPFWREGGMVVNEKAERLMTESLGIQAMPSDVGFRVLEEGLCKSKRQFLAVLGMRSKVRVTLGMDKPVDLNAESPQYGASRFLATEPERPTTSANTAKDPVPSETSAPEPAVKPTTGKSRIADDELRKQTESFLKEVLSKETKLPVHKIQSEEPLEEYGLDSVMILTLNDKLEEVFGELSKTLLFEYQTIAELAGYFLEDHQEKLVARFGTTAEDETVEVVDVVDSDSEADRIPDRRAFFQQAHSDRPREDEPIAIIGVAGRYPQARNLDEFWENLQAGRDCIVEIPDDRWDWRAIYDPDKDAKGKTYSKWGGFIDKADHFDPLFFNISPREAELMDPQERQFLEVATQAVGDAGYTRNSLERADVGVYVGVMWGPYQMFGAEETIKGNPIAVDSSYATIANRVSYWFNLKGPSVAVDSMCSSSLTSIHFACEALHRGEIEMAIAGGVNLSLHNSKYLLLSQGKFTASDGRCRSFGEGGDGYVPGEGVGAVILKPLSKAQADGDMIYAVVRGTSINHGGKTNGYTVPNPNAQARLISKALERARVSPRTLSYIEAHGTGTSLGDPIEIAGLNKAFRDDDVDKQSVPIGSVKSNIGHLEAAAGIAGLTKVLLQMKHRKLVPSIHSTTLNPNINFSESPFKVQQDLSIWKQPSLVTDGEETAIPRRAGISSFGAGGSNAHVILEEYKQVDEVTSSGPSRQLILLSARNRERLSAYAGDILLYLQRCLEGEAYTEPDQDEIIARIARDLRDMVAALLTIDADDIDIHEDFSELGFDPVAGTALASQIDDVFNLAVPTTWFTIYPTIHQLSTHLCRHHKKVFLNHYGLGEAANEKPGHDTAFALEASGENLCLERIAYTLQVGREAMPYRMAFVVNTIKEMVHYLQQFVDGNTDLDHFFIGDAKENQNTSGLMIEGEEGEDFIQQILAKRRLSKLGQLWIGGVDIDWQLLYGSSRRPTRISLPTQPYQHKRYWIDTVPVPWEQTSSGQVAKLHPLLTRNTSTFQEERFTLDLTANDPVIRDHVLAGHPVMPGFSILEMALAAGRFAAEKTTRRLRKIAWADPISLPAGSTTNREIHMALYPGRTAVDFEVTANGTRGVLYAQGELIMDGPQPNAESHDLAVLRKQCHGTIDPDAVYNRLNSLGLHLGPAMRSLKEVYLGDDMALGQLHLQNTDIDPTACVLHPGLAKAAKAMVTQMLGQTARLPLMPFTLDEVTIHTPLSVTGWVLVKQKDIGENVRQNSFDVVFMDEQGNACASFKGLRFRSLRGRVFSKAVTRAGDPIYSRAAWQTAASTTPAMPTGQLLLLARDAVQADSLRERLRKVGSKSTVVLVEPGDRFRAKADDHFTVAPNQTEDFAKVFKALQEKDGFPSAIIYDWPRQTPSTDVDEALYYGLHGCFHLSKALLAAKPAQRIDLLFLHACEDNDVEPVYGAMAGWMKTLRAESTRLRGKVLALHRDMHPMRVWDAVLGEIGRDDAVDVRCDDHNRWQRVEEEFDPIPLRSDNPNLSPREGGVYLITGGTGGLGVIFAKHMLRRYKTRLALVGRSVAGAEKEARIEELRSLGGDVRYFRADVGNLDDARRLVKDIKEAYGALNGIIHSAGVVRDAYLQQKTTDQMGQVLNAKVQGLINLDEATRDEPLEHVILFSSMSGVLGNAGQTDYAYANNFVDLFAAKREKQRQAGKRSGKTIAIAWPLWADGGMQLDERTTKLLSDTTGLTPLKTETGLQAFDQATRLPLTRFLILEGDHGKLRRTLGTAEVETSAPEPVKTVAKPSTPAAPSANDDVNIALVDALRGFIADLLKVDKSDIDLAAELSDFGFDSITFTDFSNQINARFGSEITPAIFYEHPSLRALRDYLLDTYGDKIATSLGSQQAMPVDEAPPAPAAMPLTGLQDDEEEAVTLVPRHAREEAPAAARGASSFNEAPVAIIGMAGIMPQCEDVETFWRRLVEETDLITEVPKDRWNWEDIYGDPVTEDNKTNIKWGGFIQDADKFDAPFFGISNLEAAFMDPQQRVFLETAWKTIESAGYSPGSLSGSDTGLFVGVATHDYMDLLRQNLDIEAHLTTGTSHAILVNRISYLLNLHGPSEPVDTACSSSLVALHRAIEAIRSGDCGMAIAGGVNLLLSPTMTIAGSKAGMLSEDGRCKTFDKDANGYVRAEGAGAVFLKPLRKAITDGDNILAVVKGSSVNHGGRATSLTAPNPNAQAELLIKAYERAGIDPTSLSYIETHGTGTPLGDPIEINGLKKAFAELYKRWDKPAPTKAHIGLGSVKTNVGHLEIAAGTAGLLKLLQAMRHHTLPASLHVKEQNPYIKLDDSPFRIITKTEPWTALLDENGEPLPRRAGISSFGFGGANAHVVLEEYVAPTQDPPANSSGTQVYPVSARNEDRLRDYARVLAEFLAQAEADGEQLQPAQVAYTLQVGRDAMDERLAIAADNLHQLRQKLQDFAQGEKTVDGLYRGNTRGSREKTDLLIEGREGQDFIRTIVAQRKLGKIANLWVMGVNIDWHLLHGGVDTRPPQRIPLPTYPFERKRYWVPSGKAASTISHQTGIAKLHPLVAHNTSTLQTIRFNSPLQGEDFIMRDHRVGEQRVLPGVAYLEMARVAGLLASDADPKKTVAGVQLQDIAWVKPVSMASGADRTDLEIVLSNDADGVNWEIRTAGDHDGQYHAEGRLNFGDNRVEQIQLSAVRDRCPRLIDKTSLYQMFAHMNLHYGPSFQSIEKLHANGSEALAELLLPNHLQADFDSFLLHPTLVDGALQAVTGLLQEGELQSRDPQLPYALGSLEILHPLQPRCFAYVRYAGSAAGNMKKYDIRLLDGHGNVLVRLKDFTLRTKTGTATTQTTATTASKPSSARHIHPLIDEFLVD